VAALPVPAFPTVFLSPYLGIVCRAAGPRIPMPEDPPQVH